MTLISKEEAIKAIQNLKLGTATAKVLAVSAIQNLDEIEIDDQDLQKEKRTWQKKET